MEALGADLAGGFPHHRRDLGDGGAIAPRPTDWAPARGAPGIATQVPDDRLAMVARDRGDLVQKPCALGARAKRIPRPLSRQVLPYALARHGYPLLGSNRTSAAG